MDSRSSALIIHDSSVRANKFITRKPSANKWPTMERLFLTVCETEIKIKLPKLNATAHIFAQFQVTREKSNYDIIFGRNLQ